MESFKYTKKDKTPEKTVLSLWCTEATIKDIWKLKDRIESIIGGTMTHQQFIDGILITMNNILDTQ